MTPANASNRSQGTPRSAEDGKGWIGRVLNRDGLRLVASWAALAILSRTLRFARWVLSPLRSAWERASRRQVENWYRNATRILGDSDVVFLNYGYEPNAPDDRPRLDPADEPDRLSIQLYHRVAAGTALDGADVLDVSCGHGGGASWIARCLGPRTVTGIDLNPRGIELCRRLHTVNGLSFRTGDAASLPFDDAAFDAVLNVEASHCFPDMQKFLDEVVRVLRPGGQFLFADLRWGRPAQDLLDGQLGRTGLEVVRRDVITTNVLRSMELDSGRRLDMIQQLVPRVFHGACRDFAGVEGSAIHDAFRSGRCEYLVYALQKRA